MGTYAWGSPDGIHWNILGHPTTPLYTGSDTQQVDMQLRNQMASLLNSGFQVQSFPTHTHTQLEAHFSEGFSAPPPPLLSLLDLSWCLVWASCSGRVPGCSS